MRWQIPAGSSGIKYEGKQSLPDGCEGAPEVEVVLEIEVGDQAVIPGHASAKFKDHTYW